MIKAATFLCAVVFANMGSAMECGRVPEPLTSLHLESRYDDSDRSRTTINSDRLAQAERALAPLDGFIGSLADQTQALYAKDLDKKRAAANCILDQLGEWTSADPLSDLATETAKLTVSSRYAALALVLWQARAYAPQHPQTPVILDWLHRRIEEQVHFWPTAPSGAQKGNLRAWAALAAASLFVQTDRTELGSWAKHSIQEVLCTANEDGSIPQEMSRRHLALHYQYHAIAPLMAAASLLEREGIEVTEMCQGALAKVAQFGLRELGGAKETEQITGVAQSLFNGSDQLEAFQLAWIEAYLSLFDDAQAERMANPLRPLNYSKLGGNQTALWSD